MILSSWCVLKFKSNNKVSKSSRRISPINKIECDKCKIIWIESSKIESRFDKWNGHFCRACLYVLNIKRLVKHGSTALCKLTSEERIKNARMGGVACQKSVNKDHHSFTKKRWASMTDDERKLQVTRANSALIEKLKNETYKSEHFAKIFKNSKIGYISKGQYELYNECLKIGKFELDEVYSHLKIDVVDFDKKIAIEYNGDYFHCNPKTWNELDFNKAIKMTAGEKWKSDRQRRFFLRNEGFKVIVIWESDWKSDKIKCLNKIKKIYNEIN